MTLKHKIAGFHADTSEQVSIILSTWRRTSRQGRRSERRTALLLLLLLLLLPRRDHGHAPTPTGRTSPHERRRRSLSLGAEGPPRWSTLVHHHWRRHAAHRPGHGLHAERRPGSHAPTVLRRRPWSWPLPECVRVRWPRSHVRWRCSGRWAARQQVLRPALLRFALNGGIVRANVRLVLKSNVVLCPHAVLCARGRMERDRDRAATHIHTHTHAHTYICMFIYGQYTCASQSGPLALLRRGMRTRIKTRQGTPPSSLLRTESCVRYASQYSQ